MTSTVLFLAFDIQTAGWVAIFLPDNSNVLQFNDTISVIWYATMLLNGEITTTQVFSEHIVLLPWRRLYM